MVEAAFDFLNREDLPALPVAAQADCLRTWSRVQAKGAAVEAGLVGAFNACDGPGADGQKSTAAWLARFTHSTLSAARGQVTAAMRIRRHPHVEKALADGTISVSLGRLIGGAVGAFSPEDQDGIEQILVDAAVGGATAEDLVTIVRAAERRLCPGGIERDEARRHADRGLTLSRTLDGVGRINGDLTAEAIAMAETVIEALAVKTGPEDTRTKSQRRHDGFADAMRRLLGSDLMPARGGAKPRLNLDMDLATLRNLPGAKDAEEEWIERRLAALARRRLHGDETVRELLADRSRSPLPPAFGGPAAQETDGPEGAGTFQPELPGLGEGATLPGVGPISDGLAAGLVCDSVITPIVVGAVDRNALAAMTDEWLDAHGLRRHGACDHTGGCGADCGADCGAGCGAGRGADCHQGLTAERYVLLQRSMLRWAVRVLSGPGGLASYLRTGLLEGPWPSRASCWTRAPTTGPCPRVWNGSYATGTGTAASPAATTRPCSRMCTTFCPDHEAAPRSCGTC
jgi:hypothetical protein